MGTYSLIGILRLEYGFADGEIYWFFEDGSIEAEGMVFAIFATRVDSSRQALYEFVVEFDANKALVQVLAVYATSNSPEFPLKQAVQQCCGILFPEGKHSVHSDLLQVVLPV